MLALSHAVAPFSACALLVSLTVLLARLWRDGGTAAAARPVRLYAVDPAQARSMHLWARPAADHRALLWAALAVVAWVALVVSLDARRP